MNTHNRVLRYRIEFDAAQAQTQATSLRRIFERELRQVQVAPGGGRATGGGTAGGIGGGLQSFASGAAGAFLPLGAAAAGALAARGVIDTALALDKQWTSLRRTEMAARTLTGSQAQLNEMTRAYIDVAGGAVTQGEAQVRVTQLSAIGFAKTTQQLREFATAVRGASLATGQNTDYIAQQLQLALANTSFLRLDQLGLGVAEVRNRMEELQQTVPNLTREAAFQQAVLQGLNDKYGELVKSQEAAASGTELLGAAWRQLREDMASQGSPIDAASRAIAVQLGSANLRLLRDTIQSQTTEDTNLEKALRIAMPGAVPGKRDESQQALLGLISGIMAAQEEGIAINDSYLERVESIASAVARAGGVSADQVANIAALHAEWERGTTVFDDARRESIEAARAAETYGSALDELRAKGVVALEELSGAANALPGDMGAAGWAVGLLAAKIEELPDQKSIDIQLRIGDQVIGSVNQIEQRALGAAAGLVRQGLATPQQAQSMFGLAQNQAGYFGAQAASGGLTGAELALAQAEAERKILAPFEAAEEAERQRERAAREAERQWERAADKAGQAWSDAANTFMGRLRNVPGLLGASAVTQEQMEDAKLGIPQNFADNYLRRLEDEVLNKVEHAGVDLSHIAGIAGIDQSLSPEAQVRMIRRAWDDSSLFANPDALQFLDQAAVQESLARQQQSAQGEANLLAMFGLSSEGEWLPGFGDKLFSQMREQVTGPAAMVETQSYGATLMQSVFESWEENASQYNWADAILAAAYADLSAQLEPGATPAP